MKGDIKSALEGINQTVLREDAEELEELWLNELIQRKKNESKLEPEQAKSPQQEEQKRNQSSEPRVLQKKGIE
jgi:hypothetical protein